MPNKGSTAVGRPRMVNQTLLDKMVALRRSGYSLREIAEKVGRSERTVRRYVKDVEPQVEIRMDIDTDQLMDWFDWSSSEVAHQYVQKGPKLSERASERTW